MKKDQNEKENAHEKAVHQKRRAVHGLSGVRPRLLQRLL